MDTQSSTSDRSMDVVAMLIQSNRRFCESLEKWNKKGASHAQNALIQASVRKFRIQIG